MNTAISINLRRIRKLKKLNQQELADMANISRNAYRNIETGASLPRGSNLSALARALGVSVFVLTEEIPRLQSLRFRTLHTLSGQQRAEKEQIAADVAIWLRNFNDLEEMLDGRKPYIFKERSFVGAEPFVVAYPDDLHFGEVPLARQLIQTWETTGCTVLATLHDPPDVNRYGLISIADDGLHVTGIIEKPPRGREPSREASIGRFLYTPDFLDELALQWKRHGTGEFFHTPAVLALARRGRVVYKRVEGERLDTGEPAGYLEAILRYADTVPELRKTLDRIIATRRPTA